MEIKRSVLLRIPQFLLLLTCGGPLWATDLIIESRSQGQNFAKYKETSGVWVNSQYPRHTSKSSAPGLTSQDRCGTRKAVFRGERDDKPGTATASARFSPGFSQK